MCLKFKMMRIVSIINLTDRVWAGKFIFSSTVHIKRAWEAEMLPTDAYGSQTTRLKWCVEKTFSRHLYNAINKEDIIHLENSMQKYSRKKVAINSVQNHQEHSSIGGQVVVWVSDVAPSSPRLRPNHARECILKQARQRTPNERTTSHDLRPDIRSHIESNCRKMDEMVTHMAGNTGCDTMDQHKHDTIFYGLVSKKIGCGSN